MCVIGICIECFNKSRLLVNVGDSIIITDKTKCDYCSVNNNFAEKQYGEYVEDFNELEVD